MERISILILKRLNSTITPEENQELEEWAAVSPTRRELLNRLTDPNVIKDEYSQERSINWQRPNEDMQTRISKIKRRRLFRKTLPWAASVLILIGGSGIWFANRTSTDNHLAPTARYAGTLSIESLTPGKVGAVLTNSNGKTIILEASDTAIIANQILNIAKSRSVSSKKNQSLEVGRGQEFKIVLEDSTVVYLNSESTLSYPEMFADDMRKVSVVGEACFEVKKDPNRPFVVESGGQEVTVYGTVFNVRGYADEDAVLTTLESGKVAVSVKGKKDSRLMLSPGHQSRFDNETSSVNVKKVNPEIVTGWRHGKFVFEETPLATIMKDLSRWYDFEYEFTDPALKDIVFMGSVSRHSDFRTIISILEDSGEVRFSVKNNKITISKK